MNARVWNAQKSSLAKTGKKNKKIAKAEVKIKIRKVNYKTNKKRKRSRKWNNQERLIFPGTCIY